MVRIRKLAPSVVSYAELHFSAIAMSELHELAASSSCTKLYSLLVDAEYYSWARRQQRRRDISIPRIAVRLIITAKLCQCVPMLEKHFLRRNCGWKVATNCPFFGRFCYRPRRPRLRSRMPRLYTWETVKIVLDEPGRLHWAMIFNSSEVCGWEQGREVRDLGQIEGYPGHSAVHRIYTSWVCWR